VLAPIDVREQDEPQIDPRRHSYRESGDHGVGLRVSSGVQGCPARRRPDRLEIAALSGRFGRRVERAPAVLLVAVFPP
jgi:hypothetical protein